MKKSVIFTLTVFFLMSLNILFLPIESEARNIERVSVDNSGGEGDGGSDYPSISSDGRYVAFISSATNLVTGDTSTVSDVFPLERCAAIEISYNIFRGLLTESISKTLNDIPDSV